MLSSSFSVQFHAQRHQKLSISENDKTLVLQPPNFPQTLPMYSFEAMPRLYVCNSRLFHVCNSSGFGDISQNVKGGNFMPPQRLVG